jgi:Domain of unknown function (DUF4296)
MLDNFFSKLLIFCCLLCFIACGKGGKMPIPQKQLVLVTVDMHYAEAAVQNVYGKQKDSLLRVYYKEIFQLHKVKQEDYIESIRVLQNNSKLFDKFYNEVKAKL